MPRYEVDERAGCIAVIDTTVAASCAGLHPDDAQVFWFSGGEYEESNPCPTCGHKKDRVLRITEDLRRTACIICDKMNKQDKEKEAERIMHL